MATLPVASKALTASQAGSLESGVRAIVREELVAYARGASDPWISQSESPLGRKLHCREAKKHPELEAKKVGRKVLIRRSKLDAFIEAHPIALAPSPKAAPETNELREMLSSIGWVGDRPRAPRGLRAVPGGRS